MKQTHPLYNIYIPENHMMNCILALMLTVLNRLTAKERGKMLAARPIRIKIRLHMMRLKLNDVEMVKTCIPMYRNTTVSAEGEGKMDHCAI